MTNVQRCDACGEISRYHNNEYSFAGRITDVDASPDAIDIHTEGHLCNDCAREVAELIKEITE